MNPRVAAMFEWCSKNELSLVIRFSERKDFEAGIYENWQLGLPHKFVGRGSTPNKAIADFANRLFTRDSVYVRVSTIGYVSTEAADGS